MLPETRIPELPDSCYSMSPSIFSFTQLFSKAKQCCSLAELFTAKTRVIGLSVGEDFVILACVVFTQCKRVTDGQTDGQPDRS